jgi:ABC-type glycerol-3-phosphate transport system substrate-binding protein
VTKTKTLMVLAAAAVLAAGCGGSDGGGTATSSSQPSTVSPSDMSNDQAPPSRLVIDVTIKGGNVTPSNEQLRAAANEQIIIKVSSDVDDELHVHSTPDHTFKVEPKSGQSFQFTVGVPGKVDVELHKANKIIATIAVQ